MNRTRLYIENKEIELDEEVQFLINKQWEDINNPTTIINDWSKTINIPATKANDVIFGHCYRTDRLPADIENNDGAGNLLLGEPFWGARGFGGSSNFSLVANDLNFHIKGHTYGGSNRYNHIKVDIGYLAPATTSFRVLGTLTNNINQKGQYQLTFKYTNDMNAIRLKMFASNNYFYGNNEIFIKLRNNLKNNQYYTLILNVNDYKKYNPAWYTENNGTITWRTDKQSINIDETLYTYDSAQDIYVANSTATHPDETAYYIRTANQNRYLGDNSTSPAVLIRLKNPVDIQGDELYALDIDFALEATYNKLGIHFDPYKKLNFRLEWNSSVLMTGYAKMSEIIRNDDRTYYQINLCGSLGDIFQKMKKITFDKSILQDASGETGEDMSQYVIDTDEFGVCAITKDLVYDCWTRLPIDTITGETRGLMDIIGFCPNNSFNEEFKYDSVGWSTNNITKLSDALGTGFTADVRIEPDTVIGNGLLPRGFGDFRSYNQLTYIYIPKLWEIFRKKSEQLTGYKFVMDDNWFDINNPYWGQMVMMMNPPSEIIRSEGQDNGEFNGYIRSTVLTRPDYAITLTKNTTIDTLYGAAFIKDETSKQYITEPVNYSSVFPSETVGGFIIDEGSYTMSISPLFTFNIRNNYQGYMAWLDSDRVFVQYTIYDKNGNILNSRQPLIEFRGEGTTATTGYPHSIVMSYNGMREYDPFEQSEVQFWTYQLERLVINTTSGNYKGEVQIKFDFTYQNDIIYWASKFKARMSPIWWNPVNGIPYEGVGYEISRVVRSKRLITLESIWNNSANIFDCILNYCKMHRIVIWTDDNKKEIHFQTTANFFYDGMFDSNKKLIEPEDWTDKVDYTKEFRIKPITWDTKYVKFNYDDNDDEINKSYKEKFGYNFGELRVNTHYNFNDEVNNLFEGLKLGIVSTDTIYDWDDLSVRHKIINRVAKEKFIHCKDKENKFVNNFGSFAFIDKTLGYFDTDLTNVYLTDDLPVMTLNSVFCYIGNINGVILPDYQKRVYTYPYLTNVTPNDVYYMGEIWQTFARPKKTYAYDSPTTTDNTNTLYYFVWENYISERYDKRNKVVTCYVRLKPQDMLYFKFNKFIQIGGQVYTVNKIYDYNISGNESTKIELITVQNPPKLFTSNLTKFKIQSVQGHTLEDGVLCIESPGYPYVTPSNGPTEQPNTLSSKFDFGEATRDSEIPTRWYVPMKLKETQNYMYNQSADYTSVYSLENGPAFYVNAGNNLNQGESNYMVKWTMPFNWERTATTLPYSTARHYSYGIERFVSTTISNTLKWEKYAKNEDGTTCNWITNITYTDQGNTNGWVGFDVTTNTGNIPRTAYIVIFDKIDKVEYRIKITQPEQVVNFDIIDMPTTVTHNWDNYFSYQGTLPADLQITVEGDTFTSSDWQEVANKRVRFVLVPRGYIYLGGVRNMTVTWTDENNVPQTRNYAIVVGGDFSWATGTRTFTNEAHSSNEMVDVKDGLQHTNWQITTNVDWIEGLYYVETYQQYEYPRVYYTVQQNTNGAQREGWIYAQLPTGGTKHKLKIIQQA